MAPNPSSSRSSSKFRQYKREIAPHARLYLFDLKGYGQVPLTMMTHEVYIVAGWSDKIFGILEALENGADALETIEKIAL